MNDKSQVIVDGRVCNSVDYERGVVTINQQSVEPQYAINAPDPIEHEYYLLHRGSDE